MYTHPTHSAPALRLALLLLALLGACSSTPNEDPEEPLEFRTFGPDSRTEHSIGKYLADLSTSMNAWMEKTLNASTTQESQKQELLEINIRERVHIRQAEILAELEMGPTQNRVIAAAAIGFSNDLATLSPLLAALDDPNDKVVSNALLGLTMLDSPDTPLRRIGELIRFGADPKTRWSAANCARTLIQAGADGAPILDQIRAGLTDVEEPMVRSQCALAIALLGDVDSIDALGVLLFDSVPLVSRSAAEGLAYLGQTQDTHKGEAARTLIQALTEGERELRLRIHPSLVRLSRRDYGLDEEEWTKWGAKLP